MLNIKKALTKLCGQVTTKQAHITPTGKRGFIEFRKLGDIVLCWSSGDWTSLASRQSVLIGTIPEGFRPPSYVYVGTQNEFEHKITIAFAADGQIIAYNRGAEVTSSLNGSFFAVWSTV